MKDFLPFALPDIGEDEINEVVDTLRSGWITTGKKTLNFESDFSEFIGGRRESVAVNSATAGLHLVLEAIGVNNGDEVITTPYTFTSTAEVVRYLGAHPVFVDIDSNTFNIDAAKIEQAITPRTKAIIPVHFAGLSCDMNAVLNIARKYNLKVIEDAAHALPSVYQNKIIGSLDSDAAVYSFYATKTVTTGEGGMILTRSPEIAMRCRTMRLHGISRDVFDRYTSNKTSWHYDVIAPGYKYNLTDIASSIGIHQLRKAWQFQQKRSDLAARYNEAFRTLPLTLPPTPPQGDVHSWHLYVIRLNEEVTISREDFIQHMAKKGIGCSVHFIPLHLQPYWRDAYNYKSMDFPNALHSYECAVSLPLYTKMEIEDQDRVICAVKEILT